MKISAKKLQVLKEENKKDLVRIGNLLNEKRRTLEVYGYEEENETLKSYENLLNVTKDIQKRIDTAKLLECGNYEFYSTLYPHLRRVYSRIS